MAVSTQHITDRIHELRKSLNSKGKDSNTEKTKRLLLADLQHERGVALCGNEKRYIPESCAAPARLRGKVGPSRQGKTGSTTDSEQQRAVDAVKETTMFKVMRSFNKESVSREAAMLKEQKRLAAQGKTGSKESATLFNLLTLQRLSRFVPEAAGKLLMRLHEEVQATKKQPGEKRLREMLDDAVQAVSAKKHYGQAFLMLANSPMVMASVLKVVVLAL
jgi:hypothetical protein